MHEIEMPVEMLYDVSLDYAVCLCLGYYGFCSDTEKIRKPTGEYISMFFCNFLENSEFCLKIMTEERITVHPIENGLWQSENFKTKTTSEAILKEYVFSKLGNTVNIPVSCIKLKSDLQLDVYVNQFSGETVYQISDKIGIIYSSIYTKNVLKYIKAILDN